MATNDVARDAAAIIEVIFMRRTYTEESARAWLLVHGLRCHGTCYKTEKALYFEQRPRRPWEARHIVRPYPGYPDVGIDRVT